MKKSKITAIVIMIIIIILLPFVILAISGNIHKEPPQVSLIGEKDVSILLGEKYEDEGCTATDYDGNNISDIKVSSDVDYKCAGNYTISYIAKDDKGNSTVAKRHLEIKPNLKIETDGLAICMYHDVYDEKHKPDVIDSNCIDSKYFKKHLKYLADNDYYYPSWQEVREYVEGKRILPDKSIVMTFDDARKNFLKVGVPLLEEYKVPATSFVICSKNGEKVKEKYTELKYVQFQSHSYDMHQGGGKIGHGGIFTALSKEDAVKDLNKSIDILGSSDAFAYPYGDYTDKCEEAVEEAGFICAVTTQNSKVYPGDDPLLLSRVRINGDISVDAFKSII